MTKEYMLVATKIHPKTGTRVKLVVIDRLSAGGIREAEADFKMRNDFKKLIPKNDLTIVRSERFYQ